jgi:pilus assembly protein CpaE
MNDITLIGGDGGLEYRLSRLVGDGELTKVPLDRTFQSGFDVSTVLDAAAAPCALLLGPELDQETMLWIAQSVDAMRVDTTVVAVAEPTPKLVVAAMRAGVRDVLDPDAPDEDFAKALAWAREQAIRKAPAPSPEPERRHGGGRIIVVASPKGGVGKTTIAVNMAVELARIAPSQVVVVDLDLRFGDVATMLDLKPDHSIADVFASRGGLDTLALKTYLAAHPAGLWVVAAPESPAAADAIESSHIQDLVRVLAREFRFVVIDTGSGLDEPTLAAMEVASDAVLVASPDVAGVRNLRKEVEVLAAVGVLPKRHQLVVNMADRRSGMKPEDVSAVVGLPVSTVIPRTPDMLLAGNKGVPLLFKKKQGGAAAKAMRGLAAGIAAERRRARESR